MKYPGLGLACTGWEIRNDGESVIDRYTSRGLKLEQDKRICLDDYISAALNGSAPVWTSAVAISKSSKEFLFEGFPENRSDRGGDTYTWIKTLAKIDGARSLEVSAVYHRDSDNMVTKTARSTPGLLVSLVPELKEDLTSDQLKRLKEYVNRKLLSSWSEEVVRSHKKSYFLPWHIHYTSFLEFLKLMLVGLLPVFLILLFKKK